VEWSKPMGWQPPRDLTTLFDAPPMFGKPASNILSDQHRTDQFVLYVGSTPGIGPNGLIHQLRLENDTWHHKELTPAAGNVPRAFFALNAYVQHGTQHVVYLGLSDQGVLDNQVHELFADNNNDWHPNNLTIATGATSALTTPTGYEFRDLQHVFYQGTDSHILELWHDSNGWHHNDLTNAAVVSIGPLTARVFGPKDSQHITFLGAGGAHIQELYWYEDLQWRLTDLTNASGAPLAASEPTNYSFLEQATQHINYLGTDGHVHELLWNYENGWQHNDLTFQTGAPLGGLPSGYVFSEQGTQHVVYQGNEGHIHELLRDGSGWHHNDLTPGAPDALLAGGNPMGYAVENTQHVIYTTRVTNHVIELKWTPP
jgi:hypothetical protein